MYGQRYHHLFKLRIIHENSLIIARSHLIALLIYDDNRTMNE